MADLAVTPAHKVDFSFSSSPFSTPNFDTNGDDWAILAISNFNADLTKITSITYNGVEFIGKLQLNAAAGHINPNIFGICAIALGANAGNHAFVVTFSGGGVIDMQAVAGTGAIDAAVYDGAVAITEDVAVASVSTPTPYTPATDKALPFFFYSSNGAGGAHSALANCTQFQASTLLGNALYYCPLSTPAATPTAATLNNSAGGFNAAFAFALKPGSTGLVVAGATLASGNATNAPTVVPGPVAVAGANYANSPTLNAPTIGAGAASAGAAFISSGSAVTNPSVARSGVFAIAGTVTKFEGGTFFPWQRDADNSTDITLSGTWSADTPPTGIQVERNGSGIYNALSSVVITGTTSGNWAGTMLAQAGGRGILNVRATNDHALSAATYFSLGDVYLIIGDSIAVGAKVSNLTAVAPGVYYAFNGPEFVDWNLTSGGPDSGAWALLGDEIVASQGVPVMFINKASSGSTTAAWVHGDSRFDDAMAAIPLFGLSRVKAVLLHLGVNDADSAGNTAASFKTSVQTVCTNVNTWLPGGPVPIFLAQIGPRATSGGTLRTELDAVRQGLTDAVAAGYCYMGPAYYDLTFSTDGLHPDTNDANDLARRWFMAIGDVLYGTAFGHGPRVTHISTNGAKDTFIFTFDQTLKGNVTDALVGTRIRDSVTGAKTISSQTKTATTQVTVVISSGCANTALASFASENDAVDAAAIQGVVQTLPTGATESLPAEFFMDSAVDLTQLVSLATLAAGSALHSPTAAPGAVTLTLPTIASGYQLFKPRFSGSAATPSKSKFGLTTGVG